MQQKTAKHPQKATQTASFALRVYHKKQTYKQKNQAKEHSLFPAAKQRALSIYYRKSP